MIMSYDKKKAKLPIAVPPLPDDFCPWIGKLMLAWSELERLLDGLLVALAKHNGTPDPNDINGMNFRRRKKLCKDLLKAAPLTPATVAAIKLILNDAADLHWRRNFIAHGKLTARLSVINPGTDAIAIESTLSVTSRHNGKNVTLTYKVAEVEDLFYKIAHAGGRLKQISTPGAVVPGLASSDISTLQAFLLTNHPNPPT